MPFKSEKQRRWMHANEPKMAKKWEKEKKMKKETKVRELIRKMVREIMAEGPIHHTDAKFVRIPKNDVRKAKQILKKFKDNVEIQPKAIKGMVRVTTTKKMYNKVLDTLLSKGITKIQEDFAGSYPKEHRKKFDKMRQKQSEVLGYKLTGHPDVKTEIGDATIKEGLDLKIKTDICWSMEMAWINFQQKNEYNPPHNHPCDLSFVAFLQVPKEIGEEYKAIPEIEHGKGPGILYFNYGEQLPFSVKSFGKLPERGDLFLFPGWLMHHVHDFKSDVERISVSGNVNFEVVTKTEDI